MKYLRPGLVYLGLTGLILGPLLLPGYVLSLDLVWGPHLPHVDWSSNTALLVAFINFLGVVLPSWVIEKLVLITIFMLAGTGLWRLAELRYGGWPAYVSGGLYMVNPYTYERLMAGQWLVLGGYALLPWVVAAAVKLLARPGWKRALELAVWAAALGIVSLHSLAMGSLIVLILVITHAWGRGWGAFRPALPWLGGAALLWVVLAGLWFLPLITHHSSTARLLASFDSAQFQAFRTSAGPVGVPLNTLALQGFWGERTGIVLPASTTGIWFWVAALVILATIITGAVLALRRRDRLALTLGVSALIAWILAMGIAWGPVAGLTRWLVSALPFYQGYREPGKWLAILALTYAYLVAGGLQFLRERLRGFWKVAAIVSSAAFIYMWIPVMAWGAAGQLTSRDYPAGWYELNTRLNRLPASRSPDVAVLPWHEYIELNFAGRPVASPADGFFDRAVISSNDPELPGVPPVSSTSLASSVQNNVINRRFFSDNAGSRLHALGVHYVVLLKLSDWKTYDWVSQQSDLVLVADTPDWQLYQVAGN